MTAPSRVNRQGSTGLRQELQARRKAPKIVGGRKAGSTSRDAGLAKIMPGRKARFAGKDPHCKSADAGQLIFAEVRLAGASK